MSYGSLVLYESQRIETTVLSTTVAELYSFMKCFGLCQFLHGLWMDLSGEVAKIHMGVAEHQILGGKHFLILGPESGKIRWLKKIQYLQKKYQSQWTFLRGESPKVDFSQSWQSVTTVRINPSVA